MPPDTLGQRAAAALKAAKVKATNEGRTLSWSEVASIIDACMPVQQASPEAPPEAQKRTRKELDAIFDALAAVQPGNPAQMTKHAKSQIAEARKQIMEASPNVSPEEIAKRAALYRRRWPTWHLSALALCKHWAELGPANPTAEAKRDIYQEPRWDWKAAAEKLVGSFPEAWSNWSDIPADWRTKILTTQ